MKRGIGNYQIGDQFEGFVLIKESIKGTTSSGKPFLTLILRDATGEIEAKLWDITGEDETTFIQEQIIRITGEINQFRGKAQMKISSIRLAQPTDGVHVSDLIEKAPVEREELMEKLTEAIFEMKNPTIQRLVRAIMKKYQEPLLLYPAATRN